MFPVTYDGEDAVMSNGTEEGGDGEYPCLIRATDGKKIQFSTRVCRQVLLPVQRLLTQVIQVEPGELEKFHAIYGSLLKSSMSSLRKRDKKREKQRAEVAAARKRKLAETIIVQGPKRGNGRRKHQRSVKAALRQEASRKKAAEKDPPKLT